MRFHGLPGVVPVQLRLVFAALAERGRAQSLSGARKQRRTSVGYRHVQCGQASGGHRKNSSVGTTRRRWRCGEIEEHTSELQSLMRLSYAVFCLKKKKIDKAQLNQCHY